MRTVILILILGIFPLQLTATPDTLWSRSYGGGATERVYGIQAVESGGYLVVGYTWSYGQGSSDVWLVRTNSLGDTVWTRTYGGPGHDIGYDIQSTPEGGYIIVGSFGPPGISNDTDIWLLKTDQYGDTLWTRKYKGEGIDRGTGVQPTLDGGYVLVGTTRSLGVGDNNLIMIKTDARGDTLWTRLYGGENRDEGNGVQQTEDGGYIIIGSTYATSVTTNHLWLLKVDSSGDTLWTRTYRGSASAVGEAVLQTEDGGYVALGRKMRDRFVYYEGWLLRTNAKGDTLWTQTYGGEGDHDEPADFLRTGDGGYIIAGSTRSNAVGKADVWIIGTDAAGDTLWTRTYGGDEYEFANAIQRTSEGGYIVAGTRLSEIDGSVDGWLLKLNETDPRGLRLTDVPGDQGGKVMLTWRASGFDQNVERMPYYSIWRSANLPLPSDGPLQPLFHQGELPKQPGGITYFTVDNSGEYAWEWLANQPALRLSQYAYTAPTLFNGIPSSGDTIDTRHHFMVVAHTDNPNTFYKSTPAAGYSVDNLPPAPPLALQAELNSDNTVKVTWRANREVDLSGYLVYQSNSPFSDTAQAKLVAMTSDSSIIIEEFSSGAEDHFAIVAEDIHRNRSEMGNIVVLSPTGISGDAHGSPSEMRLYPNYPNPSNPFTNIRYVIPEDGPVSLTIYDVNGREIIRLVHGHQAAGEHLAQWDGRDARGLKVSSGMYLYRLDTGKKAMTRKIIFLQ